MQSEILKMGETASKAAADRVAQLLNNVVGVAEVSVSLERKEVTVLFDEKIASTQALQTALSSAGYGVSTEKPAHGKNGSCCGSCGG